MRRLRRQPGRGRHARRRGRDRRRLARRLRRQARQAARRLGDGPGRARSPRSTVNELAAKLESGDAIIDGGNSYYRDDIRRSAAFAEQGIDYIDCGTSGGVFGLERGYCLMIGGPDEAVAAARPDLRHDRPRRRLGRAHAGTRRRSLDRRERLPALRPERRRPLREDGPQRDRVRGDGRLRRGPQHPQERRRRPAPARGRRRDRAARPTRSSTSTSSTSPRSPRSGAAAA